MPSLPGILGEEVLIELNDDKMKMLAPVLIVAHNQVLADAGCYARLVDNVMMYCA